jgi:hypothetical protein
MDETGDVVSDLRSEEYFKRFYTIGDMIGEGSFCKVYKATHILSGEIVHFRYYRLLSRLLTKTTRITLMFAMTPRRR